MFEEEKDYFKTCIPAHKKQSWIAFNKPDFYQHLLTRGVELNQALYNFLHDITETPLCKTCQKNHVKFTGLKKGYQTFCSKQCAKRDKDVIAKYRKSYVKTVKEKYGVESTWQAKEVIDKIKKTNIERYGVENVFSAPEIKEKIKETNLKKYGVEYILQNKEIQEKGKKTMIEKYGADNASRSKVLKQKIKDTNLEKYGSTCAMNSEHFLKSIKEKKIKKLNIKYPNANILTSKIGFFTCRCQHGHDFEIAMMNFIHRYNNNLSLCTVCTPINSILVSAGHNEINEFLSENDIEFETNSFDIISPLQIDTFVKSHNIAIEFNGVYWHSSRIDTPIDYHVNKFKKCKEKEIHLVQIWEDDWKFKKDIIKSRLLNLFHKNSYIIYARQCKIEKISNEIVSDFLTINHLQGAVKCKHRYGLFHNNELVSVMTLSKPRAALNSSTSIDSEYELVRFCNKLNTTVVGSASKLFQHFVKRHNPTKITSYADLDWGRGDFYEKLGFVFECYTSPGYWYVINNIRQHRYNWTKQKLIQMGHDSKMTEEEIMLSLGHYRVYGTGNAKWIWIKSF